MDQMDQMDLTIPALRVLIKWSPPGGGGDKKGSLEVGVVGAGKRAPLMLVCSCPHHIY